MKKILCLLLATLMLCGALVGCSEARGGGGKVTIVTTVFPIYDWVRNILGDKLADVELVMLLDSGIDMHNYQSQTNADDLITIATCDMFIHIGGESDSWVENALKNATNDKRVVVNLAEELGDLAIHTDAHEHEHHEGDEQEHEEHEHTIDEHIWLSLKNATVLCAALEGKLSALMPESADVLKSNLAEYTKKLEGLDSNYQQMVDTAAHKTLVFGDRFPFAYLVRDYGLQSFAAFDGCSTETAASTDTIKTLADKLDEYGLGYIMTIEGSDDSVARTVVETSEAKNAVILTVKSMQSVSMADVEAGATYLEIMDSNLTVFRYALS